MKAKTLTVSAVILGATMMTMWYQPLASAQDGNAQQASNPNTVSLHLTSAQLDPLEGNGVIRAFVPTGSKSVNCLATLNEIRTDVFPTGITLFCAERAPISFGAVPGVLISIFFTQPAPSDLTVDLTLYQKGALKYGAPVLCTANDGC